VGDEKELSPRMQAFYYIFVMNQDVLLQLDPATQARLLSARRRRQLKAVVQRVPNKAALTEGR
jgi:hypothetical protein